MPEQTRELEIKEFAYRVERLCDFFLNKVYKDGSADRQVIEDIKSDAADIQFDRVLLQADVTVGLHDYMKGI